MSTYSVLGTADKERRAQAQRLFVVSGQKAAADRRRYQRPGEKEKRAALWAAKRRERRALLDHIKMASGCVDCGYRENPLALQFDHVRGEKVGSVSTMYTGSLEKLMAEIAKCDVRCANCHSIKTHTRTD